MVTWLYNTVYNLYSRLPGSVKDLIHSVLSGLIGALNAVAGRMWTVWWDMVVIATRLERIVGWSVGGIYNNLRFLWKTTIPGIFARLDYYLKKALDFAQGVYDKAVGLIDDLTAKAWGWVQDAIRWVNQHIWTPLWGYVQDLYDKMTRWAYTAYFYVTHPDALAEVLFWSLWGVFTRNALTVSRSIGEWALRMVLQNAVTGVKLVEQIITDVL